MKKLLYFVALLLLPFVVFGDLLPEPNDVSWIIDEKTDYINDSAKLNTEDKISNENDDDKNNNEGRILNERNLTASEIEEDEELHEVWEDWWLTWISFWFCNEWIENPSSTLNYAVNQWEPFKVCFTMSNATNQDIKVRVRLVDLLNWLCSPNSTSIYQFISKEDAEQLNEIIIPAGNYIVKEFNILYPIWIQWDQWACTMFNIIKEWEAEWNVAAVVNRAYVMKFFVWSISDIKNIIDVENIELSLDDNKDLIMNFDIKNEWNLENLVELSGTISNVFGYSKKFTIEWWHVLPWNLWHVEANLWSIPSYGWLFNIDFKAFATPYFSYDISNSSVDPSLIEMKTFDFNTTYFKMPWLIIAIVIVVILLLITMFRKPKQKVVYVQQPQQPIQPQQQYYPQQNIPQQNYQQPVQPQQPIQNQQPQVQQPQQPVQPQEPQQPQQPEGQQNPWNPNIQ